MQWGLLGVLYVSSMKDDIQLFQKLAIVDNDLCQSIFKIKRRSHCRKH